MIGIILLTFIVIYIFAGLLFFIGLTVRKEVCSNEKPFVSVVIAVRNEEENIVRCLSGLSEQTYPGDNFEIVIVDDHSEDNTTGKVKEFQERLDNLRLIEIHETVKDYSPKKLALNEGIEKSKGEIIVTTDADCIVKPGWIEYMVKNFSPECGMTAGFSQISPDSKEGSFFAGIQSLDFLSMMASAAGSISVGVPLAVSGQNLAYRKKAFNDAGGFSRIKKRVSGDDVLLLQMFKKYTDYRVNFSFYKESFVTTIPCSSVKEFINQRIRWASNASYQIKTDMPFFIYLVSIYLTNLSLFITIPLSLFIRELGYLPVCCLLLKWFIDLLVLTKGAIIFKRFDLVKYFIPWEIFQMFYFITAGALGVTGKFTWKGRKY